MSAKSNIAATYADAGVDIAAGNQLVEAIGPLAEATHRTGVMGGLGGFGGLFDLAACGYEDPVLVSGTDGVGTKLKIALESGIHDTVGQDLVAMCVNDIVVQGAEPLFFLDYFATGKLESDIAENVITGIANACTESGCALLGGETAEMPGMYKEGDYDLAGFTVGVAERSQLLPRADIAEGDVILGLASSGVHSNGFSLVRHIISERLMDMSAPCPFAEGKTFAEAFLVPTKLYVQSCLKAIRTHEVKGLAHITGGGLTENIPRVLPDTLAAHIDLSSWELPPVFKWLREAGNVNQAEMLKTFNCGIGMVVITRPDNADAIASTLGDAGETVFTIGTLIRRKDDAVTYQDAW